MNLELVAIPCLGALTTRLKQIMSRHITKAKNQTTYCLTGCDLQNFSRKTNGAFDTELLVFGTADQITRNFSTLINIHIVQETNREMTNTFPDS